MVPDFDRAFRTGQRFRGANRQVQVVVTPVGHVDLPSGAVDVVDPLTWSMVADPAWAPPPPDAPPGVYRVERSDAELPVAVRIVFREERVVRWEPWEFAIGVDSATLAFCDVTKLADLSAMSDEERLSQVEALPSAGGELTLRTALGPVRMVVWPTGADGAFSCYWGLGENGEKVCALVDMIGLYEEEEVGVSLDRSALGRTGPIEHPALAAADVQLSVVRAAEKELVLRVDGYDRARGWLLRRADGGAVRYGRLFRRDEGLLVFELPEGLPDDAELFVHLSTRLVPMTCIDDQAP